MDQQFKKYSRKGAYHHRMFGSDSVYTKKIDTALSVTKPGDIVIDIGCGDGVYLRRASKIAKKVVGIDASAEGLRWARALTGSEFLSLALATHLPFRGSIADLAVIIDVINYVQDSEAMVKEVARVLKPGGRLVLLAATEEDIALGPSANIKGEQTDSWHVHRYGLQELSSLVSNHLVITNAKVLEIPISILKPWIRHVSNAMRRLKLDAARALIRKLLTRGPRVSRQGDLASGTGESRNDTMGQYDLPGFMVETGTKREYMITARKEAG